MRTFLAKHWRAFGLILSLILLALAFFKVDLTEVGRILVTANLNWVLLVVLLNFGLIALKGVRWREIIAATTPVSLLATTSATLIGCMAKQHLAGAQR